MGWVLTDQTVYPYLGIAKYISRSRLPELRTIEGAEEKLQMNSTTGDVI